ncbi:transcriptional repressor ILP1 isoform X3 [Nicotiana tabacum]|uniref:Transcriptional repressor ILP1 isoform X3 n=1 Tax=Nicotiana tabacum TaxID=4097 RepID=A0AC58SD12_TOBAC
MSALQESYVRHPLCLDYQESVAPLCNTEENLSASLSNVSALEHSLSAINEECIFMEKLRDLVCGICVCLQHKAPCIEELEDKMQKLHKERAAAILERRAADSDDDMKELVAAISAANQVLSKGGGDAETIKAVAAAALALRAAVREGGDFPVELDEFSRDGNMQNQMDVSRRANARERRRARNDVMRMPAIGSYPPIEGELDTDESDTESNAYRSQHDQLLHSTKQIFGDKHEYSEFSVVVRKFYRWKKDYTSSYRDAHVSVCIPAIFSPYVRLELLKWDPLHENANFMNVKWYTLLRKYGLSTDENPNSFDDADANPVQLVVKLAMAILHNRLAQCWDVFSTRETQCAVSAINLLLRRRLPSTDPSYTDLVNTVHERLDKAVANLTVLVLDSLVTEAVPDAARVAAYRFGMSLRLMSNICLFHNGGILAMAVIEELALDKLLCGKILPYLRGIQANIHDAIMRTEKVVSLTGIFAGDHSRKLQPLVDYVLELEKGLKEKHCSFGQEIWTHFDGFSADKSGKELVTAKSLPYLHKMLRALKEDDHAKEMSRPYFETDDPF